ELATLMTNDAERMEDGPAVERLREAASVYSGFLGQPLKAAEVLRKARQRAPNVPELVTDQAAALAAAGELDAAQRAVGEALATVQGAQRTSLLLLRASFRQQLGDDASAVQDLTEAYALDKLREMYEAAGEFRQLAGILTADADHGTDPAMRYANYKRAAELLLYQLEDAASAQGPAAHALELQPDDHGALMLNVDILITSG